MPHRMPFRRSSAAAAITLLVLLAACAEEPVNPAKQQLSSSQSLTVVAADRVDQHPGEAAFREVSATVPSFAGYALDGDKLDVYLTDTTSAQAAAAKSAIRRALASRIPTGADPALANASIAIRPASYSFTQLSQWRDVIENDLWPHLKEMISLDLNESRNRIVIGLLEGTDEAALRQWIARSDVPPEAVIAEVRGPIELNSTLADSVRPVIGGLKIAFGTSSYCTLGFNAYYQGTNVFITNSHCTAQIFGTDGTPRAFSQGGQLIGSEYYDPPMLSGFKRYSDAAMIQYQTGVSYDLGTIARTLSYSSTWGVNGSTTLDASAVPFTIGAEQEYPVQNQVVEKVGATSGWTHGQVSGTCVDALGSDGFTRLCSYEATYYATGGDSGSPVFITTGGGNPVTLVGIHWASDATIHRSSFSPLGGIHQDFGNSVITFSPPVTVSVSGPRTVGQNEFCTWTANVSGGTPPYSYRWQRSGVVVGTSQTYSASTGTSDFFLVADGSDATGQPFSQGFVVDVTTATGIC